jgi:hypothetical protein
MWCQNPEFRDILHAYLGVKTTTTESLVNRITNRRKITFAALFVSDDLCFLEHKICQSSSSLIFLPGSLLPPKQPDARENGHLRAAKGSCCTPESAPSTEHIRLYIRFYQILGAVKEITIRGQTTTIDQEKGEAAAGGAAVIRQILGRQRAPVQRSAIFRPDIPALENRDRRRGAQRHRRRIVREPVSGTQRTRVFRKSRPRIRTLLPTLTQQMPNSGITHWIIVDKLIDSGVVAFGF